MSIVIGLIGGTQIEDLAIPAFLNDQDPRPAKEQFDGNYQHGGGWRPISRATVDKHAVMHFPGDPPLKPIAAIRMRDETIYIYRYGLVCIWQRDGSHEVSRMD